MIAWVLVLLTKAAVIDAVTLGIALVGALALFRYRLNTAWLVLAGGLLGLLFFDIKLHALR